MATVTKRTAARRDLLEHVVYLAESAGLEVAEHFCSNAATIVVALILPF
jgi:hypothetical protein